MTTHQFDCNTVRGLLWEFHTEKLPCSDAAAVADHLSHCRECELHSLEDKSLSAGLRHLPRMSVSPLLATRLRIIASKEREIELYRHNFLGRMREFLLRQR